MFEGYHNSLQPTLYRDTTKVLNFEAVKRSQSGGEGVDPCFYVWHCHSCNAGMPQEPVNDRGSKSREISVKAAAPHNDLEELESQQSQPSLCSRWIETTARPKLASPYVFSLNWGPWVSLCRSSTGHLRRDHWERGKRFRGEMIGSESYEKVILTRIFHMFGVDWGHRSD